MHIFFYLIIKHIYWLEEMFAMMHCKTYLPILNQQSSYLPHAENYLIKRDPFQIHRTHVSLLSKFLMYFQDVEVGAFGRPFMCIKTDCTNEFRMSKRWEMI